MHGAWIRLCMRCSTCRPAGRHGLRPSCDAGRGPGLLLRPPQGRALSRTEEATEGGVLVVDSSAGAPKSLQHRLGSTVMTLEASKPEPLLAGFAAQHHSFCMCMMITVMVQHNFQNALCMTRFQADHHKCRHCRPLRMMFLVDNISFPPGRALSTWPNDQMPKHDSPRRYPSHQERNT